MKLIHAAGFSKSDREDYRVIIFSNLLNSFKAVIEAMEAYDLKFSKPENQVCAWPHLTSLATSDGGFDSMLTCFPESRHTLS